MPTLGRVVAELAVGLGLTLHPWQEHRADVSYELTDTVACRRRLAAGVCLTIAGRQTGKTTAVTADVAMRCLAPDLHAVADLVGHPVGPQHVAFTAQDRIGALGRWREHVEMIMDSELAGHVAKVVLKNGEECVNWHNGSKYRVVTPSRTGARGLALDLVVIDEALAHEPWLLDVMGPTMSQRDGASTSFGAQLIVVSNAGDEHAELLNQQRELGRRAVAEDDRSRVHLEWSCADDDDPLDPQTWARTIPTLDQPEGLTTAQLSRMAETMGTDAFAREYLCRTTWSQSRQVIAPDVWSELPYGQVDNVSVVAVEVDADRAGAAVVAAAPVDELVAVKVLEVRPGVDWVVDYVAATGAQVAVVDNYGPASTLIPALAQRVQVHKASSHDVADAAAGFVDAVTAGRVANTGDPRLQDAVTSLARRQRGDRWVFDRHRGDVSTIVAASLAVWLVDTQPVRYEPAGVF